MKKNYILFTFLLIFMSKNYAQELFASSNAPSNGTDINRDTNAILFEQLPDGTEGIVSDHFSSTANAVFSAEDFNLTESYSIDIITAYGFQNDLNLESVITGLDVFIYADNAGVPSSDPTSPGTGLLEIINLDPMSSALTINADGVGGYNFVIDVAAATGSALTLDAGTYWLVVAPYVVSSGSDRWNWYQSTDGTLSEAHLIDPTDFFGAGATSWTSFSALGLAFSSCAFTIEGTTLGLEEFSISKVLLRPNPTSDVVNIEMNPSNTVKSIELYAITGQLLYKGQNELQIEMSKYNTGVYLLKITTAKGSTTKRIVKQ